MVVDVHSHYMPPKVAENTMFFKAGWSDLNQQLATMDRNGIVKSVLLYPTSDAHIQMGGWRKLCTVYNSAISQVVREHPDRFVGAGIVPCDSPEAIEGELKHILDRGLRVISMASSYEGRYLDDEMFFPIYEFAQKHEMPIHVHPQIIKPIGEDRVRDPLLTPVLEYMYDVSMCLGKMMMSRTFLKFQDVVFIFAHYGGVLPLVKERFDSTYTMLRKRNFVNDIFMLPSEYFKNLYFDTSGSKSVASLGCALEVTDSEHILFGSDFPANQKIYDSVSAVHLTDLSDDNKQNILMKNALRLLK